MAVLKAVEGGVEIALKVVPGASRDRIVGRMGDALKVQVTAPPEKGRANRAVASLLAARLQVSVKTVSVVRGLSSPHKVVLVTGLTPDRVETGLGLS